MSKVTEETYRAVMSAYNYYCVMNECLEDADELHHRMPKSKPNKLKYPLFIHSPINLIPLCKHHHTHSKHLFNITDKQAQMYEDWIEELKSK